MAENDLASGLNVELLDFIFCLYKNNVGVVFVSEVFCAIKLVVSEIVAIFKVKLVDHLETVGKRELTKLFHIVKNV